MPTTIAAPATAPLQASVAVLRLSGPLAGPIAQELTQHQPLPERRALYRTFRDGDTDIDSGLLLYFKAPHSFTGEDVVEFQIHGSPLLMAQLMEACLKRGATPARKGEFSARAFENGKMSLLEAEGIQSMIAAESLLELEASRRLLSGEYEQTLRSLEDSLLELRAQVEASFDFELEFDLSPEQLRRAFGKVLAALHPLLSQLHQGELLKTQPRVVLLGPPNAGKSSLFNALLGEDRALVDALAGTTRDLNVATLKTAAFSFECIDTAGLRTQGASDLETRGMQKALEAARKASLILWISEASALTNPPPELSSLPRLHVGSKSDLLDNPTRLTLKQAHPEVFYLNTRTGEGLEDLKRELSSRFGHDKEALLLLPHHHATLLEFKKALETLSESPWEGREELLAFELQAWHERLRRLHEEDRADAASNEALYDRVFSHFCVGK